MLCSILGIKPYRINHVCYMMKKHESSEEDMRRKHNNRPNGVSEWRKDVLKTLIKKLPYYRSYFTRRKKSKQVFSFS